MAKFVASALIGQISRSAGSTTFARNRFGAYFRNRVMPTNPVTTPQSLVRGNLGSLAGQWRTLTQTQRNDWAGLGLNMIRTDSLGQSYSLTGEQAFIAINRNLFTLGSTTVLNAPVWTPPPALTTITVTATAGTPALSMAYTATPLITGNKLVVQATRQLSQGVNFQPRGAYKQIFVSAAAAASPAVLLTAYTALFGALVAGKKILFRTQVISANGIPSPIANASVIVAA